MKALTDQGAKDVRVDNVPAPILVADDDLILGLTFKMAQPHAQRFMSELLEHIGDGKMKPEVIITHRMQLEDAARAYEIFEKRQEECRKVVLTP